MNQGDDVTLRPVEQLRRLHGLSTVAWSHGGTLELDDAHWISLSGARSADYNLALCHGPRGAEHIQASIDRMVSARQPAIIAVAGEAKDAEATFADSRWVRVGSAPLMVIDTAIGRPDPDARELTAEELPAARALVEEVFDLTPEVAEVALTVDANAVEGRSVWGLYDGDELVSCLVAMYVEDAMVIWSMATSPRGRRRGYGQRLLSSSLHAAHERGTEIGLLHASSDGEPFYLAAGYRIVERWDFWSRPRWVLRAS